MPNEISACILFVDDEPEILTALTRLLRNTGVTLYTATSAEKGLQILEQQYVDIVISDKNMPGMNGMEFLQKVAWRRGIVREAVQCGRGDTRLFRSPGLCRAISSLPFRPECG